MAILGIAGIQAGRSSQRAAAIAALAVLAGVVSIPRAQAADAITVFPANCTGTYTAKSLNSDSAMGVMGGSAAAISSTISAIAGSVDTAFLSQQGSAFVSAPGNPDPGQPGGGVWVRSLGGEVTTKTQTTNVGVGGGGYDGRVVSSHCNDTLRQTYAGMQVGTDLSRLNINGWNVHIGATAGHLSSTAVNSGFLNGGMRTGIDVPFVGGYVTATHGPFFADLMVRQEFYNFNVDAPYLGLDQQPISAHALSVSASVGANIALPNNFFIEPSAGFIWSRTSVDGFTSVVPTDSTQNGVNVGVGGTTIVNTVNSEIGRLSIRTGTTIATSNVIYQPFVTASVFHDFAGDITANYTLCPNCAGATYGQIQYNLQSDTTRIGTYAQLSAGVTARIPATAWMGFVRGDYKYGSTIQGYAGNLGLRYQFEPTGAESAVAFAKTPQHAVAAGGPTNWTGFYLGAFAGGAYGRSNIAFPDAAAPTGTSPYTSGSLGGIEAGYNYQINNWVLGAEGEFAFAKLKGASQCGNSYGSRINGADPINFAGVDPTNFDPLVQKCSDRMNWMGTFAGRLGYTFGRTLLYAKGGAAWADGSIGVDCVDGSNANSYCYDTNGNHYPNSTTGLYANGTGMAVSTSFNRLGWLAGLGTEFDLGGNWSAKAEYDYIQFGSGTKTASDGSTRLYNRTALNEVKIGLNYRFGDRNSSASIVPSYAKAIPAAPIRDWRGFYLGGNIGFARASDTWHYYDGTGLATSNGLPGYINDGTHTSAGVAAGGQAGYRVQLDRVVLGIEAQGNWASLNGYNSSLRYVTGNNDLLRDETRINGLGVFTGQLGYTVFDALFYLKGGAMVANERYNVHQDVLVLPDYSWNTTSLVGTTSALRWGAAVGAGAEYAFASNWSGGIDYVHGFLGGQTYEFPNASGDETSRINQGIDMVTLRVNYRFAPDSWLARQ